MGSGGSGGTGGGGNVGAANAPGGTGYGGNVGARGTAGEASSGAGGAAMAGYGNTAAGGSGMAGISTHSGNTAAGFTPGYGDPRGTAIGMGPSGNYAGYTSADKGSGGAPFNINAQIAAQQKFSTPIPTQTSALLAPKTFFGQYGPPPRSGYPAYGIHPNQAVPGYGYSPGMKGPFSTGGSNTAQGYQGVNPGLRDRMGVNPGTAGSGPRGYQGGAYGNTQGPVGGRRS